MRCECAEWGPDHDSHSIVSPLSCLVCERWIQYSKEALRHLNRQWLRIMGVEHFLMPKESEASK